MSECDRCGDDIEQGHPLDGVVHPFDNWVCENCLRDTDTVVDV